MGRVIVFIVSHIVIMIIRVVYYSRSEKITIIRNFVGIDTVVGYFILVILTTIIIILNLLALISLILVIIEKIIYWFFLITFRSVTIGYTFNTVSLCSLMMKGCYFWYFVPRNWN